MVTDKSSIQYETIDYDPFEGPEIIALAPATESQKEIWLSCILGGDDASRAFNESVTLKFTGALNKAALERSLYELAERHELLRAAFSADGKHICIFKNSYKEIAYKDLSNISIDEQAEVLTHNAREAVLSVFDLLNGPLFKSSLLKLSDNKFNLTLTAHHIICDGWSISLILHELGQLYSAYAQNIAVNLPPAASFSEYSNEKLSFYHSKEYEATEAFWINQYKEKVPVLKLPIDFTRPSVRTYSSNRLDFKLDEQSTLDVKRLSNVSGCTFVSTLINVFEIFLHQLTGDDTLVIGLPAADQAVTGKYNLVGHCVNLLPLKSSIDTRTSFIDYVKQRKKEILDAFDHQQFTFGSLLKKLNILRDVSTVALVPVVFNVDMGMLDEVNFLGLEYKYISNPRAFETFEIFLNVTGSERSLTFEWSYNTQLFQPQTIHHMMAGFKNILKTVADNPAITIEDIRLDSADDLLSELNLLNKTEALYPHNKSVHYLISEAAKKFANKTALVFGNKKISHSELNSSANQFAHHLINHKIGKGDIVGVALERSAEMLIAILAVMKTGAAFVPLDITFPRDRITYMLHDSSAKSIIISKKHAGKYGNKVEEIFIEDLVSASLNLWKQETKTNVFGEDLAYILYTSGSTGKPKGVLIRHNSLVNMLGSVAEMPGMSANDVLLAVTTISFDIAYVELFLPLITGATIVLADANVARNGRELLQIISEQNITVMQATPATYKMLLAAGWQQPLPIKIICAGEPMSKDLADKLLSLCSSLYNMYGPTETTVYSTGKRILKNDEIITIGKPINNTQVYILDEDLKAVPKGAAGEIYIAGDGVGNGYINLPELTAEKFLKDPFSPSGGKMYKTGDLGEFLPNGEIQCLGRIDRQIKLRGFRIEPGEIEQAIIKNMECCNEAIVVSQKDTRLHEILVAYVVFKGTAPKNNFAEKIAKLKLQLKAELPAYMVPDNFINLIHFPLLPNGKIDYKALPKVHTQVVNKPEFEYTKAEKLVSEVWKEYLGIKNIGINDNFFLLGGHSMIAVEVMMRLEKETGIKLPLSSLFEYPTIKKFSTLLQSDHKETVWKSLVPIKPTGNKMPVYIIHGSGSNILNFSSFALHVDADQPVYGLQAKGLTGSDEPLDNMEKIAEYYITEVLVHNPGGPYAIAGYSFGGYVAVEMARQLRLMGKEVKMVAMFDTNAEEHLSGKNKLYKLSNKIIRQFKKGRWIASMLLKQPKTTIKYQLSYLNRKTRFISKAISSAEEQQPEGYLLELQRISRLNDQAYYNYRLEPFDGKIDLFKAKERVYFVDDFKYLGWKKYALKGVKVHEVPGDHRTMLLSPNDKVFARTLQKALDEC